jgi:hypothetical protein
VVDPEDMTKCIDCDFGTYQPNDRPTEDKCLACPNGTSTNTTKATSQAACMRTLC